MTNLELCSIIQALSLTPADVAAIVGRHERTVTRWMYDEVKVPKLVADKMRELARAGVKGKVGA